MFGSSPVSTSLPDSSISLTFVDGRYCVGTRRQALLNQEQIDHCLRLIESDNITNYEARMVAEVSLYWIIYKNSCGQYIKFSEVKQVLQIWRRDWATLFGASLLLSSKASC